MVVLGRLAGALAFAFVFPEFEEHLMAIGRYGKVRLHGELGMAGIWLAARLPLKRENRDDAHCGL